MTYLTLLLRGLRTFGPLKFISSSKVWTLRNWKLIWYSQHENWFLPPGYSGAMFSKLEQGSPLERKTNPELISNFPAQLLGTKTFQKRHMEKQRHFTWRNRTSNIFKRKTFISTQWGGNHKVNEGFIHLTL